MAPRLELQDLLIEILDSDNVYFQPPSNVQMQYPCIVYQFEFIKIDRADNDVHIMSNRYLVTVIDRDPDTEIPEKVAKLPLCAPDRFYMADNLNHYTFKLFF